jgi:hypothetical protein
LAGKPQGPSKPSPFDIRFRYPEWQEGPSIPKNDLFNIKILAMKTTFKKILVQLDQQELKQLTQECEERIAIHHFRRTKRHFTEIDLWNIRRNNKPKASRRWL